MYVVISPETGDMRRFEEEDPKAALLRAVAAAQPGQIVALIRRGSISRVWTATPEGGAAVSADLGSSRP
jgi:hypothetical protein